MADTILVYSDARAEKPTKYLADGEKVWNRIDVNVLRKNLEEVLSKLGGALPAKDKVKGFSVTEIEVALTIGAAGQVGLLGTGVEVSGTASLTVHLTRAPA
jgi:hypothetical protein